MSKYANIRNLILIFLIGIIGTILGAVIKKSLSKKKIKVTEENLQTVVESDIKNIKK